MDGHRPIVRCRRSPSERWAPKPNVSNDSTGDCSFTRLKGHEIYSREDGPLKGERTMPDRDDEDQLVGSDRVDEESLSENDLEAAAAGVEDPPVIVGGGS